jgi:sirohydrochlorin cobaltochelatase
VSGGGQRARGVVLFAHGARDPRWAEPFERLASLVGERLGAERVTLAYLELMQPDLDGAITSLVEAGCEAATIVPVFLGQGSHLRKDLPRLVDAARSRHPQLRIDVANAVGEDPGVLAAIADYCVHAHGRSAP